MNVEVLLFAVAREKAGADRIELELPTGSTVADLWKELGIRHPALASVLASCRAAVDESFATAKTPLADGATVAVLPPVSGG